MSYPPVDFQFLNGFDAQNVFVSMFLARITKNLVRKKLSQLYCGSSTRFNKIAIKTTPHMATDKAPLGLSRVHNHVDIKV